MLAPTMMPIVWVVVRSCFWGVGTMAVSEGGLGRGVVWAGVVGVGADAVNVVNMWVGEVLIVVRVVSGRRVDRVRDKELTVEAGSLVVLSARAILKFRRWPSTITAAPKSSAVQVSREQESKEGFSRPGKAHNCPPRHSRSETSLEVDVMFSSKAAARGPASGQVPGSRQESPRYLAGSAIGPPKGPLALRPLQVLSSGAIRGRMRLLDQTGRGLGH